MNHTCKLWLMSVMLSCSVFSANAAVVFEDSFDANSITSASNPDSTWSTIKRDPFYTFLTTSISDGLLVMETDDATYGGIATNQSSDFNFFDQELTFVYEGLLLESRGDSDKKSQWVRLGIVAGSSSGWTGLSHFILTYNGNGRFDVQVKQKAPLGDGLESTATKVFRIPAFNFDPNELSGVEITLNSTHYRILFTFSSHLDQLSFAGEHGLSRDLWFADTIGYATAERNLNNAQTALDNANLSGDDASILNAQNNYDAALAAFETKQLERDGILGDSSLFIAGSSFDAKTLIARQSTVVGATVTLDNIRVETSDILSILQAP